MAYSIRIKVGDLALEAELNDTQTADRVYRALPLEAEASRWGDEIYFGTLVKAGKGDPMRAEMAVGEIGFWPPGRAFCIFWGPTPASAGSAPVAASPVVPIGRVVGDLKCLSDVADGTAIRIEAGPGGGPP